MQRITHTVLTGSHAGIQLTPHLYNDGYFRAHKTNSRVDPEGMRVRTVSELVDLVRLGYHVRMSNKAAGHPPSTVKPTIA